MNPLRQYLASCLAEREPKRKAYLILSLQMQKGGNKNDDDDSINKNDEKKWVIGDTITIRGVYLNLLTRPPIPQ